MVYLIIKLGLRATSILPQTNAVFIDAVVHVTNFIDITVTMQYYQVLIMLLILGLFSPAVGVQAGYLAVAFQSSLSAITAVTSVATATPPSSADIGCGSTLAGFLLPPCPATTAPVGFPVTEIPWNLGPTPSDFTLPLLTGSTAVSLTTVTSMLSPVTVTQTVTYAYPMTTVTADCFDDTEDILIPCTTVIPLPPSTPSTSLSPSSSKSAALHTAINPITSVTSSKVYQFLFGQRQIRISTRGSAKRIVKRASNSACSGAIAAIFMGSVTGVVFLTIVARIFCRASVGERPLVLTQAIALLCLGSCGWLFLVGLGNINDC